MAPQFTLEQTVIPDLGTPQFSSPLARPGEGKAWRRLFTSDSERVRYRVELGDHNVDEEGLSFEKAGPRERIFFEPSRTSAAIVTCGGLSPGINNVIRSAVSELAKNYGVQRILGFRYGLSGFRPDAPPPLSLTPELVRDIHKLGGSFLGSARGPVEAGIIADTLEREKIDLLLCIGGDGTQRAAHKIAQELKRRGVKKSVIGVPKTIDNDVPYVYTSFGFATAVEESSRIIQQAAVEAHSYLNSVAIVKLMGRNAGFIATHATLAAQEVDFTLIPEVHFDLEGEQGLIALVEQKLARQGSVVIVLSEGAGQNLFSGAEDEFDASGNRLQHDIGLLLRRRLEKAFEQRGKEIILRYFDPGYSIRAVPANVADAHYCDILARAAVHAAMAGKTDTLIGLWYNNLTHVPLKLAASEEKRLRPQQELWQRLLAVTGQPRIIGGPAPAA